MLSVRPAYHRASCRATTEGEACLSVARSYLPTAALPRRGSGSVSSEAFAAMLSVRPAYHRASCRATTEGEACLSVASSYLPTAALPPRGSLSVSSEAFAALLPCPRPAYHRASCRATMEGKPACQ